MKNQSFRLLIVGSILTCFTVSFSADAEESSASATRTVAAIPQVTAPAPAAAESTATSVLPLGSVKAPKFGDFAVTGGVKVLTNSARRMELDQAKGRRVYGKTEYFAGINHASGFGLQAMAVTKGTTYGSTATDQNVYGAGNPSVSILHPIYKSSDVKATGMFRKYFNVTDGAKTADHNHVAYYQNTVVTLARGWSVGNLLVPRTFLKGQYQDRDTIINVDDTTTVSKTIYPWMKLGAGTMFDFERHHAAANGTSLQVFPTAIFTPSENIYVQAAFYMPVHKVNVVDDTPERVALDNSQAQLFMQISM